MQNKLAHREGQIYKLIGTGHSAKEIADTLGVEVTTAQTTICKIKTKKGRQKATELAIQFACEYFG